MTPMGHGLDTGIDLLARNPVVYEAWFRLVPAGESHTVSMQRIQLEERDHRSGA